jgi:uncharacterized protein
LNERTTVDRGGAGLPCCIYRCIVDCALRWDQAKSETNLHERGFDFAFATLIFDGPTFEVEDHRREYGERRVVAIGVADNIHLTVVYTDRQSGQGEVLRRIISSHRSNRRERTIYQKAIKSAAPPKPGPS